MEGREGGREEWALGEGERGKGGTQREEKGGRGGGWGEEEEGAGAGPGTGGGMRARWTRRRALCGESSLKGEALGGRFLPGSEPGKEGGGVCARPLLAEDSVFESGVGAGGRPVGSPRSDQKRRHLAQRK